MSTRPISIEASHAGAMAWVFARKTKQANRRKGREIFRQIYRPQPAIASSSRQTPSPVTERVFVIEEIGNASCQQLGKVLMEWRQHAEYRMIVACEEFSSQRCNAANRDTFILEDCLSMIHNIRLYLDYMLIEGQRGFMISTFEPETKEKMIQGIALCTISDDEKANEEIVIDGLLSAPRNLILGTDKKEIGLEYRCRGAGTQLMHHIYKLGQQLGRQHLYLNSTITGQGFYYGLGMKRIYCLGHITFYMPIDRGIPPSFTAKTYLPVLNLSQ